MLESHRPAEHCMVCGKPLRYNEAPVPVSCHFCDMGTTSPILCDEGHYVCDACHVAEASARLLQLTERVAGAAPEEILEELLRLSALPMHGPEHHSVAGLALLVAAAKAGYPLPQQTLAEALRRGLQVPGGACGYLGACGAGVSVGVAVSLIAGATPLKGPERGLANRATGRALQEVGDAHPRCCKRALRAAVRAGRRFLAEEMGLLFPFPGASTVCRDTARNRECPGLQCAFFPGGTVCS